MSALSAVDLTNPFPGLRPFRESESDLFFGQDDQVEELFERLGSARFVAVLGVSGCGKSSLVGAGLIPMLTGGGRGSEPLWSVATCRPGSSPIPNLARVLDKCVPGSLGPDRVEASLRRHSLGLADYPGGLLKPYQRLLVVIDQFEELFTYRQQSPTPDKDDEAALFVKLLLTAASEPSSQVYVVITMRSEYIGDCAQFYGLSEAVNSGLYLLPKMSRQQCAETITGPVARRGAVIAPQLVQELLNEMEEREDGLPLLQHALRQIWDKWLRGKQPDRSIGMEDFKLADPKPSFTLIDQHLDRHLDSIFEELSEDRKQIARCMFKLITDRDTKGREIRRPTSLDDIQLVAAATRSEVDAVAAHFRDEKRGRTFLIARTDEIDAKLDLSHECLMRRWAQLRDWMSDEQQDQEQFQRLAEAADRYDARKGDELSGLDLVSLDEWQTQFVPSAAWASRYEGPEDKELGRRRRDFGAAIRFLELSRARKTDADELRRKQAEEQEGQRILVASAEARAEAAEARAKLAHDEAQRKRRKAFLYRLAAFAAVAALIAAGAVAIAMWRLQDLAEKRRKEADAGRAAAQEQKKIADKQTVRALQEAERAKVAEESVRRAVIDVTRQAQEAKAANVQLRNEQGKVQAANVGLALKQQESESRRLESEQRGTDLNNALGNLKKQTEDLAAQGAALANANAVLEAQSRQARSLTESDALVTASDAPLPSDASLAYAVEALRTLVRGLPQGDINSATRAAVSRAYTAIGHALQRPLRVAHQGFPAYVGSVAFKDGKSMIGIGVNRQKSSEMVNSDGKTWSNPTVRYAGRGVGKVPSLLLHRLEPDVVQAVALSPGGELAAEGTSEGYVFTFAPFDLDFNRSRPRSYPITVLAFSPTATYLAAASGAGGWSIFEVNSRKALAHDDSRDLTITHMALSDGADWLAYATLQGTVRAVDSKTNKTVELGTMSGLRGLDITGAGRLVIAHDQLEHSRQCLQIVDVASRARTAKQSLCSDQPFTAVAFSPSQALLAAATRSGTVDIWNAKTFERVSRFTGLPNGIVQLRFNAGEASFTILAEGGEAEVWPVSVKSGDLEPWRFYTTPTSTAQLQSDLKLLESKTRALTEQERQATVNRVP